MLVQETSYVEASTKSYFHNEMRSDPIMTAIHFQRRFNALLHKTINGPTKP